MSIGPFTTYAPPGVYTRTVVENVVGQLLGGLRVPVLIGVGQENLTQSDVEIIRGSSSVADTPIFGEDPTGRWKTGGTNVNPTIGNQDGSLTNFRVRNYPIVDGDGVGRVTFDVTKVSVTVNGQQAVVSKVDGTNGFIQLLVAPNPDDAVAINYFFHRRDTRTTDDVSEQIDSTAAALVAPKVETYVVQSSVNDVIELFVDDSLIVTQIKLTAGTRSATDIANDVNAAAVSGLTATVHIDNQGLNHVQFIALKNLKVGSGTANGILGFNPGVYTNRNRTFKVFNGPIVDGSDGGITTTDTSKVVVLVDGFQVIPTSVNGANSTVTLSQAPRNGSTVTIQYYFNTWQDTFDFLPNSNIISVGNVGIAPSRRDFLNGPDFIIVNDGDQSKIMWGTAWQVVAGDTTGTSDFDSTQIQGLLVDDRIYGVECTRFTDPTTNTVSTTKFTMPLKPTTGNGRDTPLGQSLYQTVTNGRIDLPTNRPDLVTVYVGKTFRDAFLRPAVEVVQVDSSTNTLVLKNPVPADLKAFATFWYNRIVDNTYSFRVATPGASGIGKYTITSEVNNNAPLFGVKFGTKNTLAQTVQWPSGVETIPDAFHYGGTPVSETVTVKFLTSLLPATHASFSNANPDPYDIYSYSRQFGGVVIDGNSPVTVNLATAFKAELVSQPISSAGALVFASTDNLVLQVDGVTIAPIDLSGATTLTGVVSAINAAIDADVQVHADGSATFSSSSPNTLASAVTYGAQSLLKIVGRNTPTATNGLQSNVTVLSPTQVGQTDASPKVQLGPNQVAVGSYNALNQPALIVGANAGPFSISSGVNNSFLFNIDGQDYSAVLPTGASVPAAAVVDYINAGYASTASSTDQALILTAANTLANEIKADYNAHRTQGSVHAANDTTNIITAATASSLATLLTLCADIRTQLNAHYSNSGGSYHTIPDIVNPITVAAPTDLKTAVQFLYIAKTSYNAHRTQSGVHASNDTVNVTTASNLQLVAQLGQGIRLDKVVLVSQTNTVASVVGISVLGTANDRLGFTAGDSVVRTQPTATTIANALNASSAFNALAVAYRVLASGLGNYLRIDSLTAGSTSTISFTNVSNTAFVTDTGIGIIPGTSGDTGEAAQSGFQVSSSNPTGSAGTGTPGQTYTDLVTGLRFTVLPASSGDYANNGTFTLIVDSTFTADASIPTRSVPGVELTIFNTLNMGIGTTALVTTYQRGGNEPAVGDIYYISYQFAKTDLSTKLFRDLKKIQQNFGPPTPEFPLSLAARLALLNGAVLIGLKQILKADDSSQASIGSFITAIDEQKKPIEGSVLPDVITPLGTDPQIFAYLNQHCVFMSAPRQEGERIGVIGVASGTVPLGVSAIAQGLQSELMVVAYPDSYIVSVQDNNSQSFDQLVDGSFMAAAMSGASCNPSIDVATPWTRRQILGFKRLGRTLDPTEANQVAIAGVSVVEQINSDIRIRHGLTTRMDSVITRTPSVTLTIQYVQQSIRAVLDPFIGQKFTGSLIKAVENALVGLFARLIDQIIVSKVAGISVQLDDGDPTIMRTESIYVPIFPLEYVVSTLNVRIRI
jgi:hypothetical protein